MSSIIAERMLNIKPSPILSITDKANQLKSKGLKCCIMSAGEPDFDIPEHIKQAAIAAINNGKNKYTSVSGTQELKEAIINKFEKDNGLTYKANQICVTVGAKQALYNLFMSTINDNDEVIIPAPYWASYVDMVAISGGKSVIIECKQENNFKLLPAPLEEKITSKTKWLMINSPNNPTGAVYTYDDLKDIAQVLLKYPHVNIVTDDIYEHIIYDDQKFFNIAQVEPKLYERVFIINGASKAYSMTGWRIGYIAGKSDVIDAVSTIQSQSTSNPNSIAQAATVAALNGNHDFLKERAEVFRKRRDMVIGKLQEIPGLSAFVPNGAFYLFISCNDLIGKCTKKGKLIANDLNFAEYLLDDYLVAVVPGVAFGMQNFIRISYAASEEQLSYGCDQITKACKSLYR
ncbi:MAG: aspartate aminotransferase [Candidatus Mesenet longicola]|uniref:Aminotransferase n=1 Tax=Candidatus Mesenet longicola TaxID=1892558 RepID=A0A8J3HND2_9RICK|nr:MAG: aspartate aminotransferase [Candidatus Mesenet longicola]GHM59034.1 MAG: aspartate aminotransferase [Candidatus Mesenet longicola]